MNTQEFTIDDLKRSLAEAAGMDDDLDLGGDTLDALFEDLGYDSLALMETGTRIERSYGIKIDESALVDATTPRALLKVVNDRLATRLEVPHGS